MINKELLNFETKTNFESSLQLNLELAIDEIADLKKQLDICKAALEKIIEMNLQTARDRYGDSTKADKWACVVVAREALNPTDKKEV